MKIIRTLPARHDIEAIWLYVAKRNPRAADQILIDIDERIAILETFPNAGVPCHDLARGLRRLVAGNYLIFYRKEGEIIYIVRVLHGNRNISSRIFESGS